MADFQVIRRKSKSAPAEQDLTQDDQSSLLSKAGAGAMSGLHTVGSILSWPSRLVHGAINAAVGGKEGFGENYFNPFDSRGGVEGSRHLINAGILAENNPNEWEWGDLGRGLADIALDPTTYMGPGLTKAGRAAANTAVDAVGKSALVKGTVASHAAGHRALLNVGLPFADPILSIGTGPGTAKALESIGKYSGITRAKNALDKSWLANHWRSAMDARYRGISHPVAGKEVANASDELAGLKKNSIGDVIRFKETPEFVAMHQDDLRRGLEGVEKSAVQGGYVPHPAAADEALNPHVMIHINPQGKINEHFADAAHNGLLDEAIQAGQPINAPLMHLDETGKPVLGKGAVNLKSNKIKDLAKHAFDEEMAALAKKTEGLPMWADDAAKQAAKNAPFSVTDTLHSHFPGSLNTETVAFRDIMKATGKTPAEIVEALNKEIPGGYSLQRHDLPSQIIDEGRQAEHFWSPKDPGDIGSHDKAFVGFSLRPETGKAIADAKAAVNQVGNATHVVQDATHTIPWDELTKATGKTREEIQKHLSEIAPKKFRFDDSGIKAKSGFDPSTVTSDVASSYAKLSKEAAERYAAQMDTAENRALNASVNKTWDKNQAKLKQQLGSPDAGPKLTIHPERQKIIDESKALEKNRSARLQEHAARIAKELQDASTTDEAIATLAKMRDLKEQNMAVMVPRDQAKQIQRLFGGGPRERLVSETTQQLMDHPEFPNIQSMVSDNLAREQEHGFGLGSELIDPATGRYFPRRESVTAAKQAEKSIEQRGSSALAAQTAGDVGREDIFKGNFEGTVGKNRILKDEELHDAIANQGVKAAKDLAVRKYGHIEDRFYHNAAQRQAVESAAAAKERLAAKVAAKQQEIDNVATIAQQLRGKPGAEKNIAKVERHLKNLAKGQAKDAESLKLADAAHIKALEDTTDRFDGLIDYMKANPELKGVDKFGNNPFSDLGFSRIANDEKFAMTKAVQNTIRKELNKGDGGVTLRDFLEGKGYKLKAMAEKIAGKKFDDAKELKAFVDGNTIDSGLAEQLKQLSPSYKAPADVNEVADKFKSFMSWWKGLTLAFPASRTRDAVGGAVWNILHGWGNPQFYGDIKKILTGGIVTTDYSHVKEVKDWLRKSGKEWSHETQTEALRQLIATHIPSNHNILNDIPTGQVGVKKDDFLTVPGREKTTVFKQFIGDPLKTAVGMDGKTSWFGRGEAGDTLVGRIKKAVTHPFTQVRGVGDAKETLLAPVAASEKVAAHSDAYNRGAPFLNMLNQGVDAHIAGKKVNRAQVDYDPATFSASERAIKNYLLPFYSFNSRILPETLRELSNFGSPTSQLVKTVDRSHGGGDPSVPDHIMSGTGIPLGTRADGSKTYLTGLGQMYEPAVSQIGLAAGTLNDPRAAGALMYDSAAMLNPLIGVPLQRMTGQSFFQRGAPIRDMDPIVGRLLSNIGESTGLMEAGSRPVDVPGSAYIDTALGGTPFGRAVGQVRTLFDPRKDALSKAADTLSGMRVADVSPEKQMATLQKRAEDLARSQGAWEQRTVGFPKEQLAKLALTNPELAAEQQHLQNMITMMKRKRTIHRKQKKAAEKK